MTRPTTGVASRAPRSCFGAPTGSGPCTTSSRSGASKRTGPADERSTAATSSPRNVPRRRQPNSSPSSARDAHETLEVDRRPLCGVTAASRTCWANRLPNSSRTAPSKSAPCAAVSARPTAPESCSGHPPAAAGRAAARRDRPPPPHRSTCAGRQSDYHKPGTDKVEPTSPDRSVAGLAWR